jgi:hypothetical protein
VAAVLAAAFAGFLAAGLVAGASVAGFLAAALGAGFLAAGFFASVLAPALAVVRPAALVAGLLAVLRVVAIFKMLRQRPDPRDKRMRI